MAEVHYHLWSIQEYNGRGGRFLTQNSNIQEALDQYLWKREEQERKKSEKKVHIHVEKITHETSFELLGAEKTGKEIFYDHFIDFICEELGSERKELERLYLFQLQGSEEE